MHQLTQVQWDLAIGGGLGILGCVGIVLGVVIGFFAFMYPLGGESYLVWISMWILAGLSTLVGIVALTVLGILIW